jgi:hypothetical protein
MDDALPRSEVAGDPGTDSGLIQPPDDLPDQWGWLLLSEAALQRVWDNDEDAIHDNWKELYSLP